MLDAAASSEPEVVAETEPSYEHEGADGQSALMSELQGLRLMALHKRALSEGRRRKN